MGGCLPAGYVGIDRAQDAVWQALAVGLPRSARVLDLATGDGVVLRKLQRHRRDLKLTGVDFSRDLPKSPTGSTLRGGVAMEALPFKSASINAVTSQFGFEYGDMAAVAQEAARVLRPHGTVTLVTHRLDGSILKHNLVRRSGLRWVRNEMALLTRARSMLTLREIGPALSPVFSEAITEAITQFGSDSVACELATAIVTALTAGRSMPKAAVRDVLDELDSRSSNEVARIDALEAACHRVGDGRAVEQALTAAGLAAVKITELRDFSEPGSVVFGYSISARKG